MTTNATGKNGNALHTDKQSNKYWSGYRLKYSHDSKLCLQLNGFPTLSAILKYHGSGDLRIHSYSKKTKKKTNTIKYNAIRARAIIIIIHHVAVLNYFSIPAASPHLHAFAALITKQNDAVDN